MSDLGLSPAVLAQLHDVFAAYPAVEVVKIFGSRAKGTFNERSDIDLVVIGDALDRFVVAEMRLRIDASDIPYLVDLQDYASLNNRQLIDHIDRVGVEIYRRSERATPPLTSDSAPWSTPRQTG